MLLFPSDADDPLRGRARFDREKYRQLLRRGLLLLQSMRRRRRCFSGSIRNWDNSFNHPLIENIVVKKAKGKETKSFVRLVLPVPNDFASFLFLFINLLFYLNVHQKPYNFQG